MSVSIIKTNKGVDFVAPETPGAPSIAARRPTEIDLIVPTSAAHDHHYYEVYRSTDDVSFTKVGEAHDQHVGWTGVFTDEGPLGAEQTYYYALVDVDLSGNVSASRGASVSAQVTSVLGNIGFARAIGRAAVVQVIQNSWSVVPNFTVDRALAFPQYINDIAGRFFNGTGHTHSLINVDVPQISYDAATDRIVVSADPGSDTSDVVRMSSEVTQSSDWLARIAGPDVVWYHGFENDAEVDNFRYVPGYGIDPNELGAGTPAGSYTRRITTDPQFPNGCLETYWPAGFSANNIANWWRPLTPLPGAANGKGADDPGAGIPLGSWDPTDRDAHDNNNLGQKYQWMHPSYADGNEIGSDFYMQLRVKFPSSRTNQPPGKLLYLDGPVSCYHEIVVNPPSSLGSVFSQYTNFGNRSNSNMHEPQGWIDGGFNVNQPTIEWFAQRYPGTYGGWDSAHHQPGSDVVDTSGPALQSNFNQCSYNSISCNNCWCYPSDEWITLLFYFNPGHGSPPLEGWSGDPNAAEFFAAYDDPNFAKTAVTVWAAASNLPNGTTAYTKIWDKQDYVWRWGQDHHSAIDLRGWSILKFAAYSNGQPAVADTYHRIAEVIFSKSTIPCPQV